MSKIFLIGDSHIGLGYPNNVDKWYKVHREYFSEFLIPLLRREAGPHDIIVHLGDLFDNRNVIPINLMNYAMDIIEEISSIAPLHIIIGNHDLWSRSASEINSIRPFRYIPNITVYDNTSVLEYNGLRILMMPYVENKSDQIRLIQENSDCDYLFCHSDLNGCKMHLTSVAHKNTDKINISDFNSFKKVRSGHIHLVQENKNFTFVGSIFQMDRNDIGDQKGIFVIDTVDGSEVFFPNNISPVFKKFLVKDESSIDELDSIKNTKDYIDLTISNSLLMSSRKLRRKLETLLEVGNFASIEYLDDIVKTDSEKSELKMTDEELSVSIQLDYEEVIRKYILDMKFDSESFRIGMLDEFKEILRVYNESYKKKDV